ncbi:hypothetical protein [Aestuariibacter sp. A3R04]|uniref:hypothetical protein n=1 Tax=Aestuariibacter sp. A3R04 TaxID=2841571 RepID=UPI001C083DF3|nr:hypothetical protein [Aestuariibacter sp. A3R04]MBU3023226.1 hypothetical protein [Aestuariibacter sp. A3R04]
MNCFLKDELAARDTAQENYKAAQKNAEYALNDVKLNTRLLMAKPAGLLTFFGAGVYQGATSENPSSKRKKAVFTLFRTALLNMLS